MTSQIPDSELVIVAMRILEAESVTWAEALVMAEALIVWANR